MLIFFATIKDEQSRNKLEALYIKYGKDMFKVSYRVLNDYQLAQDAVQAAFIKLVGNLDKIDEINCNKTRAFVVIIVRNISINMYRERKRRNHMSLEGMEDALPDDSQMIDEKLISMEMFSQIVSKIKELHPAYSDIISLKFFYFYSDNEIAKILNITQENVRVRLYRAKRSLIKLLSQSEELIENGWFFGSESGG
ncbi:RNA polymerase sigma factor [Anaerosolibacter sp.]|uniref:RNA polymerase sigma factor n=1 Tax=Anaerosolibacter sp. TaxID=1872527 RepID=UPI0039F0B7E7